MNDQEFDDAIRKKLEGIGQAFTSADVDKVLQHVTTARPGFWQWIKAHWYLPAIGVVTMGAVLFYLLTVQPSPNAETSINPAKLSTSDTIPSAVSGISTNRNDSIQLKTEISAAQEPVIARPPSGQPTSGIVNPLHLAKPKAPSKAISRNKQSRNDQEIARYASNQTSYTQGNVQLTNEVTGVTARKGLADPVVIPDESVTSDIVDSGNKLIAESENRVSTNSQMPVDLIPDAPDKSHADESVTSKESITSAPKKKLYLKPPTVRGLRLSSDYSLGNLGFGPAIHAKLLSEKGFGFETGIRYISSVTEKFDNREAMERDKHHHMNPRINDHLHDNDVLTNITIKNQLLQVPLRLSYSILMRKQFSLALAMGTDWDVYVNQKLDFVQHSDSSGNHPDYFRERGKVVPFNSFFFSVGVSKQWKRLSFQFSPYLSPALKPAFYKPRDVEVGVSAGIGYYFGK